MTPPLRLLATRSALRTAAVNSSAAYAPARSISGAAVRVRPRCRCRPGAIPPPASLPPLHRPCGARALATEPSKGAVDGAGPADKDVPPAAAAGDGGGDVPPPPTDDPARAGEDLRETVSRLSGAGSSGPSGQSSSSSPVGEDVPRRVMEAFGSFSSGVRETWDEMVAPKDRNVNKVLGGGTGQAPTAAAAGETEAYDGPSELMAVEGDEDVWERMQKRMAEAPIIKEILGASHKVFEKSGAKKVAKKVNDRVNDMSFDARETWETSQNPWVYRLSSVWDTFTAESEFAVAVRELRRLDPDFSLEEFKEDVLEGMVPDVMRHILNGRTADLKPIMSESVYGRVASEIRLRKQEGLVVDPHILGIDNSEILAAKTDEVDKGSPIIVMYFQCQQINCVRNREGEVVDGGEDEIRANMYVVAFQREYDEVGGQLVWKIVDLMLNGSQPWL